jgi:hypothetical protein
MKRLVKAELLDELPPQDGQAIRARHDLQRVNAWMRHPDLMAQALRASAGGESARRMVDLGAGDGTFLLRVARHLGPGWGGTSALLLDRVSVVSAETWQGFAALGWQVELLEAEALGWLERPGTEVGGTLVANLFLHHFEGSQLAAVLAAAARQARRFIALEPRRSERSLVFSHMLWLIGCSQVTRYDAPTSVRAGFYDQELSQLWPAGAGWALQERPVGVFSHLFIAERKG